MPHGMHAIPAAATSAGEGSLAIAPDTFLAGFHALLRPICSLFPGHRPLKAESWGSTFVSSVV